MEQECTEQGSVVYAMDEGSIDSSSKIRISK